MFSSKKSIRRACKGEFASRSSGLAAIAGESRLKTGCRDAFLLINGRMKGARNKWCVGAGFDSLSRNVEIIAGNIDMLDKLGPS